MVQLSIGRIDCLEKTSEASSKYHDETKTWEKKIKTSSLVVIWFILDLITSLDLPWAASNPFATQLLKCETHHYFCWLLDPSTDLLTPCTDLLKTSAHRFWLVQGQRVYMEIKTLTRMICVPRFNRVSESCRRACWREGQRYIQDLGSLQSLECSPCTQLRNMADAL